MSGLIELHGRVARGFRNAKTTAAECCSSAEDHSHDPTLIGEEPGITGGGAGLLVATDRRALFVAEGVINHSFEDFPYRINTVTSTRGMVFGSILVNTAGAARVVDQVVKGEAERVAAILRERVEAVTRER